MMFVNELSVDDPSDRQLPSGQLLIAFSHVRPTKDITFGYHKIENCTVLTCKIVGADTLKVVKEVNARCYVLTNEIPGFRKACISGQFTVFASVAMWTLTPKSVEMKGILLRGGYILILFYYCSQSNIC